MRMRVDIRNWTTKGRDLLTNSATRCSQHTISTSSAVRQRLAAKCKLMLHTSLRQRLAAKCKLQLHTSLWLSSTLGLRVRCKRSLAMPNTQEKIFSCGITLAMVVKSKNKPQPRNVCNAKNGQQEENLEAMRLYIVNSTTNSKETFNVSHHLAVETVSGVSIFQVSSQLPVHVCVSFPRF